MIKFDKLNSWLSSAKGAIVQIAAFLGIATIIAYLVHIEHLPKLSMVESVTAIAGFGAFAAIIILP